MISFFKKAGLVIHILLCLLLWLACYGTSINEGDYWFMGLFPLAAPFFLAGVILFIFIWLFTRKLFMIPGLLTLIFCYKPIGHILPFRYTPGFYKEKNEKAIRVMSWNVEHFNISHTHEKPEVKKEMINLIKSYQPDLACFQEMVAGDQPEGRINYMGEFTKQLGLKYYYYTYLPIFDFDERHHFGTIIFSRFPFVSTKTIEGKPHDYNSTYQYADIKKGNDTFRIINIHLQTLRFSPSNRSYLEDPIQRGADDIRESKSILTKFRNSFIARHKQADQVRKIMNESPYPIILCGDFNDVPNSYAYNKIGQNMKNAFAEAGYGMSATYSQIVPTLRIDNIFCDQTMEVKQYTRVPKKLSDHYPVIADILTDN